MKYEVGQVWKSNSTGKSFTIVKVGKWNSSFGALYFQDGIEKIFGYCESNGEGDLDLNHWELEHSPAAISYSRECKCGIFRGDCTYHKD